MRKAPPRAVIFDLDGVITRTASVHFKAWKTVFDEYLRLRESREKEPFREFTYEDYLTYVDGKPRYEGVKSFLTSRGITLPYGEVEDSPERETICGLGNRKNIVFREVLKREGVEVYGSTIEFIKKLIEVKVEVGVVSSSKNCKYILEAAGLEGLFKVRIDGEVSSQLKLKGKPEPDMFLKACFELGSFPRETVIVEDAFSGVEAGRNGEFGLVLGIARKNNSQGLFKYGADIVVRDISEITLSDIERWFLRKPVPLFEFWSPVSEAPQIIIREFFPKELESIFHKLNPVFFEPAERRFFCGKEPVFFLDYDGTLTPIVERPELAFLSSKTKGLLEKLSRHYRVSIVSGRTVEDVERLVGIRNIFYAGVHGLEIKTPDHYMVEEKAKEFLVLIPEIKKRLREELEGLEGVIIEDKKLSLAIHYRLCKEKDIPKIEEKVTRELNFNKSIRLIKGKKVLEILPSIQQDKARAVNQIMEVLGVNWIKNLVIYIGDDTTDETVFFFIRTRGVGILVSEEDRTSGADFRISSIQEVNDFLEKFLTLDKKPIKRES